MSDYQLGVYCRALWDGELEDDIPYVDRVADTAKALEAIVDALRSMENSKGILLIGSNVRMGVEFIHWHMNIWLDMAQSELCIFVCYPVHWLRKNSHRPKLHSCE